MKFAFALAVVFLVGYAAADDRTIAESLEKRAEALATKTKTELEALKKDHAHLISHLQHELELVDGIVTSLKTQLADKTKKFETAQVNVIEEDLKHLENSISEEIKTIEETKNHVPTATKNSDLVTKGEALIKKANEALAKHKNTKEAATIEKEVAEVEKLIKAIQAKPDATELKKDEEQLARLEKTLEKEITKAGHRIKLPIKLPKLPHIPGLPTGF